MGGNDSNFRFSERTLALAQQAIDGYALRDVKIRDIDNQEFQGIQVSDFLDDLRRNSDLRFAYAADVQLGVRIRRNKYLGRYGNEFTIRSQAVYGGATEIDKIKDGYGKYFFYGFANPGETALVRWFIGDFNVFRRWHADRTAAGLSTHCHEIKNDDGTRGHAFRLVSLPEHFVVAKWSPDRGYRALPVPMGLF